MEIDNYIVTDTTIKETGNKYNKAPREIKILLLLQFNNKQLTTKDFLKDGFIIRQHIKPILDKLVLDNCVIRDRSKIPFKYSITNKGLLITNDFYKSLKRATKKSHKKSR